MSSFFTAAASQVELFHSLLAQQVIHLIPDFAVCYETEGNISTESKTSTLMMSNHFIRLNWSRLSLVGTINLPAKTKIVFNGRILVNVWPQHDECSASISSFFVNNSLNLNLRDKVSPNFKDSKRLWIELV